MQISKISTQNFGQLYFDNKNTELAVRLAIEDLPKEKRNKVYKLIAQNKMSSRFDIYVEKNGGVSVTDREKGGKLPVIGGHALSALEAALGYASIKERRNEHIES